MKTKQTILIKALTLGTYFKVGTDTNQSHATVPTLKLAQPKFPTWGSTELMDSTETNQSHATVP